MLIPLWLALAWPSQAGPTRRRPAAHYTGRLGPGQVGACLGLPGAVAAESELTQSIMMFQLEVLPSQLQL